MAGVAFTGLASGLNSAQIIEALLTTDRSRIDALKAQKTTLTNRVSSIGQVKSKLSTLISKLEALRFTHQVMARSATSSNTAGASATATSAAALGSFTLTVDQLATATKRAGATGIGDQTIDPTAALASAGLSLTPTAGKFMVNGVSIDASTATSVQDFIDAINAQQASVIAEGYDAGGNAVASNDPTMVGLRLRNADGSDTAIQLGSAGDTSNFLTAMKLSTATQAGDRVESTSTLGRLSVSATLANARLATPLGAGTGTFTINGVSFNWDSSVDTVNSLVVKINSSSANVTAAYDAVSDRLSLTSKNTGAQSIAVADTSGNLMAALGVTDAAGAAETLGKNALYRVDSVAGGVQQSSTSNTVAGVVQGVTFTLLKQGETSTITVNQDVDKPLAAMKEFIAAFNDASEFIRQATKRDSETAAGGPLQGDSSVRMVATQIRSMATSSVAGLTGPYTSLMDLGVSSGAVGAAAGTTNNLQLDEEKFKAALAADPNAVYDVLSSATVGSEGVFHNIRTYLNTLTLPSGILDSMTSSSNRLQTDLDARIKESDRRLEQKRARLEAQFARMEGAIAQLQAQGNRLNSQLAKLG